MGKKRAPCCDKTQVRRGPWSDEESKILKAFIEKHGHGNWRSLPKLAGLKRCGKSCRLRWINYLRPDLKRGNFTKEEEDTIIQLHQSLGNKWSKIASHFPGRTDNEIKNVWNTHLKKRLIKSTNSSSPSASSDVTNHSVSSSSTSSNSSAMKDVTINSEMPNKEEEFEDILVDQVPCGLELNAPQSLECLFEDSQVPPTISKPQESQDIHWKADDDDVWSRLIEPGFGDSDEWLNFFG